MPRSYAFFFRYFRPPRMPRKSRLCCEHGLRLRVDELSRLIDDVAEHLRGQHTRLCVVARAVIAIEQGQRRQDMRAPMSKGELRSPFAACLHKAVMGDAA